LWTLLPTSAALVYHYWAPRAPELDRQERGSRLFCLSRNYTYIILKRLLLLRRLAFLGWWFIIGERGAWELGSVAVDTLQGG